MTPGIITVACRHNIANTGRINVQCGFTTSVCRGGEGHTNQEKILVLVVCRAGYTLADDFVGLTHASAWLRAEAAQKNAGFATP